MRKSSGKCGKRAKVSKRFSTILGNAIIRKRWRMVPPATSNTAHDRHSVFRNSSNGVRVE
jgi:hypothetical protein